MQKINLENILYLKSRGLTILGPLYKKDKEIEGYVKRRFMWDG